MRWGEAIGLERELLTPGHINVEWQLREVNGVFHRLAPKDDSYRGTEWEPRLPVDLPPFLAALLAGQAKRHPRDRCVCHDQHGGSGLYVFTGPDGGHYRRSNYASNQRCRASRWRHRSRATKTKDQEREKT